VNRIRAALSVLAAAVRLGPRDGATCLWAWLLLHAWAVRLRLAGPLGGSAGPAPWSGGDSVDAAPPSEVVRLVALFGEAARHPAVGLWCHPRALALRQLLRGHGFEADLAVGLRRDRDGLRGHAWVVLDGRALGSDGAVAEDYGRCRAA
jgi:hypothetical protein